VPVMSDVTEVKLADNGDSRDDVWEGRNEWKRAGGDRLLKK